MSSLWRKLDNTAKIFSLEEKNNNNIFRLSILLKEEVDSTILKSATIKALEMYPSYKVKLGTGIFWKYLENNMAEPIVEEESEVVCKNINLKKNNEYLFKVTYFKNKINLDVFHVLTDGSGAIVFLKGILYNYLNLKYNLKTDYKEVIKYYGLIQDEYLKQVDKKLVCREKLNKAFLIKEKSNLSSNRTYHYILDLQKFKSICKNYNVSITEYLTALYIYAIYNTIYDKSSNRDIIITMPIDLRRHYNVESFSNFFTCANIEGNVLNVNELSFNKILNQVHKEFRNKLTLDNIKKYLSRDVKLGTNVGIRLIPLIIKQIFMKYFGKFINQTATSTLSNVGQIRVEEQYKKYIDNIIVLVSVGSIQNVKCTICSYENNLTVTINSNLISNSLENEFYNLLVEHIGIVKLESNEGW